MNHVAQSIRNFLSSPVKVMGLCAVFLCTSLVFDGTLWEVAKLHRTENLLKEKITETKLEIKKTERLMAQAQDPVFIERQALDRLDLAAENDLLFIFSDSSD